MSVTDRQTGREYTALSAAICGKYSQRKNYKYIDFALTPTRPENSFILTLILYYFAAAALCNKPVYLLVCLSICCQNPYKTT